MPVTARQPGLRPETIRTRLARFMPIRAGAGWSVTWTGHIEHREEIAEEEELRASEHVGCYGSALAHTLGQAGAAPTRLRITVETAATPDMEARALTVEVRARIPGMDQAVFESIARRAESACPVWKALAAEVGMRLVATLEDPSAAEAAAPPASAPHTSAAAPLEVTARVAQPRPSFGARAPRRRPAWLTPKMSLAMVGVLVLGMRLYAMMAA